MASKQLWRWHGITGDGNAQDGMLWAESRALLLMALQQQMVTPLSLKDVYKRQILALQPHCIINIYLFLYDLL